MLAMLALVGFELDRMYLRPLRQLKVVESEMQLSTHRRAYSGIDAEVLVLGNSILKQAQSAYVSDSVSALFAVPGDFAVKLGAWDDLLTNAPCKVVVVQLGVNDLLAGISGDEVLQAYRAFAHSQAEQDRQVWFMGVLPVELEWSPYVRPHQIERERLVVLDGLQAEDALWYLSETEMILQGAASGHTTDGVHLSSEAVLRMVKCFEQVLPGLAD